MAYIGAETLGSAHASAGPMKAFRGRRGDDERTDKYYPYVVVLMECAGADIARACEVSEETCGTAAHEGYFQRGETSRCRTCSG